MRRQCRRSIELEMLSDGWIFKQLVQSITMWPSTLAYED
jgi:hypothetical protein